MHYSCGFPCAGRLFVQLEAVGAGVHVHALLPPAGAQCADASAASLALHPPALPSCSIWAAALAVLSAISRLRACKLVIDEQQLRVGSARQGAGASTRVVAGSKHAVPGTVALTPAVLVTMIPVIGSALCLVRVGGVVVVGGGGGGGGVGPMVGLRKASSCCACGCPVPLRRTHAGRPRWAQFVAHPDPTPTAGPAAGTGGSCAAVSAKCRPATTAGSRTCARGL